MLDGEKVFLKRQRARPLENEVGYRNNFPNLRLVSS
jgi:hypothetical protein